MAGSLLKLAVAVSQPTTTAVPTAIRYFYKFAADTTISSTATAINSTEFMDDTGTTLTGNFTTATASNGYYQVFVNGQLQESSTYSVAANGATISLTSATSRDRKSVV